MIFPGSNIMNKDVSIPILLDLYGKLLSNSQYEDLDSYYSHDLSLAEIADNVGKSRQGVFDSIKRAEAILTSMEDKLGFLSRINDIRNDFRLIEKIVKSLEIPQSSDFSKQTQKLKSILKITSKYKNI